MPLSIFQHESLSHYREVHGQACEFGHTFGGDPASLGIRFANCEPIHLLYLLNQADPKVVLNLPGINRVPLFYHFSFASFDGELVYRVLNDSEIEMVAPKDQPFDPDFPFPGYPRVFPAGPISFNEQEYDPTRAPGALQLAGVFGVDHLSDAEMIRAVKMVRDDSTLFEDWGSGPGTPGVSFPDWSPEELVRNVYSEPFAQSRPLKTCKNPNCDVEIAYRSEGLVVREDSLRVFALHQPYEHEEILWHDPYVQLVFQVCECCECIHVSNQCD